MRVTSGVARGIPLKTVDNANTRPTLDKVKQAIFSSIQFDVPGSFVLDLFAGSGALGIEALSRGAKEAVFVDSSNECADIIRENLAKTKLSGDVVKSDWEAYLKNCNKTFDFIFLDPPYDTPCLQNAVSYLAQNSRLLGDNAKIICESRDGYILDSRGFEIIKSAKYGQVAVTWLKHGGENGI
jgi:16S rRNA (guanine(966)-N(2))-methyltransferase RsmD